jgi:hypothetical protein
MVLLSPKEPHKTSLLAQPEAFNWSFGGTANLAVLPGSLTVSMQ